MTDLSTELSPRKAKPIRTAVYQNKAVSREGFSERLFALAFSGLVYPQIWEDPEIDMEAMALGEGHRVVTIASGGCNILAYLTRSPASHRRRRPQQGAYRAQPHEARGLWRICPRMPTCSASSARRATGTTALPTISSSRPTSTQPRAAIGKSAAGAANAVLPCSRRISTAPACSACSSGSATSRRRLYGVNPADLMKADGMPRQRRFFEEELAPLFNRRLIRWTTSLKSSLFALGIPPAQYDALVSAGDGEMARVLSMRLEKLVCHFPLKDNYFAWQAFARRYPAPGEAALPAYLEETNYRTIRAHVGRVKIHHRNIVELLKAKPANSVDRFILLDAQDWMSDRQLNDLWTEITRTAAPGARVIFRTAAEPTLLPGRIDDALLDQWGYRDAESIDFTRRDRSAIYGGFHLYVKSA